MALIASPSEPQSTVISAITDAAGKTALVIPRAIWRTGIQVRCRQQPLCHNEQ